MCAFAVGDMKNVTPEKKPGEGGEIGKRPLNPQLAEIASNSAPGKSYSPVVVAGLVRLGEFAMLLAAGLAIDEFYVSPVWGRSLDYYFAASAMAALAVIVLQLLGLYSTPVFRAPLPHGLRIAAGWSIVFVFALTIVFFFQLGGSFSRVWLLSWYVSGLALLAVERLAVAMIVRRLSQQGKLDRRTVIVGGGVLADPVLRQLAAQDDGDLRILGIFDDRTDTRSPDIVAGYPKLGTVDDLVDFARHTRIDLVIFTLPISAEARLLQMLRKLWVLPIDIRLAAHTNKLRFRPRSPIPISALSRSSTSSTSRSPTGMSFSRMSSTGRSARSASSPCRRSWGSSRSP